MNIWYYLPALVLAATAEASTAPDWKITRDKSSIDGSPTISARIRPTAVSGGEGAQPVYLSFNCRDHITTVVLGTGRVEADDRATVLVSFGEEPPEPMSWIVGDQVVGLAASSAVPFLKRLGNGQKLVFRVDDARRLEATFSLGFAATIIGEIAQTCAWEQ